MENVAVKKHEEELLQKLREAEGARVKAEERAKNAEANVKSTVQNKTKTAAAEEVEEQERIPVFSPTKKTSSPSVVTMDEFLDFRKDIVEKIRDLEDEIHQLKYEKFKKK